MTTERPTYVEILFRMLRAVVEKALTTKGGGREGERERRRRRRKRKDREKEGKEEVTEEKMKECSGKHAVR